MTKEKNQKVFSSRKDKRATVYGRDDNPLPGRTPSDAFFGALAAVERMREEKK